MSADDAELAGETVLKELDVVLAGRALEKSPQLRAMLKYVVNETLAGRASAIKAYSIAVDVLGRDEDFDPGTDTIVRVQAGRLRAALDEYYEDEGRARPVRITLPKGTYVPRFERCSIGDVTRGSTTASVKTANISGNAVRHPGTPASSDTPPPPARNSAIARYLLLAVAAACLLSTFAVFLKLTLLESQRTDREAATAAAPHDRPPVNALLLVPFEALTDTPDDSRLARALTAELATSLTQSRLLDLHTLSSNTQRSDADIRKLAADQGARWILSGVLNQSKGHQHVNVFLTDVSTGRSVWSHGYAQDSQEVTAGTLADAISLDLRPQLYTAAKTALQSRTHLTPVELFIMSTWSPGQEVNSSEWQQGQITLARKAIETDPEFGPAYSVLADKLSLLANYIPAFDTSANWEESATAVRKASTLAPHSSEVAFNLALYHLHAGNKDDTLSLLARTLELAPRHTLARFWITSLPFFCDEAPTSELEALRRFDAQLSPSNPVRWQTQAWLARLNFNNENYDAAIAAAKKSMSIVPNLGAALFLVSALVHNGEVSEAKRIFDDQMVYWEGFDFDHYVDVALPRMCRGSPILERLQIIHREAAKALR